MFRSTLSENSPIVTCRKREQVSEWRRHLAKDVVPVVLKPSLDAVMVRGGNVPLRSATLTVTSSGRSRKILDHLLWTVHEGRTHGIIPAGFG